MHSRLNKPATRVVKLLVFALVVHLFVIPQIGGARHALTLLSSVEPVLLVVALMLEVASLLAYARMTQLLLPVGHRPGLAVTFGVVMASTGVNHVVPGGMATTAAVNYRLLGRAGVPADELGFALGTQAIGSAVVLNVVLWIALLASIPASGYQPVYATAAAVGAALMAIFGGAIAMMLKGREVLASRISALAGRLPRVSGEAVHQVILDLTDQVRLLASDSQRLRMVSGLAAANWLLDAAALWVVLAAFGSHTAIVGLVVAYGLANVMAVIPVSPGGLGVIEAVMIPSLVGFGVPRAEASIGVIAYRLINFWLPIPVGAVSYVAVGRATGAAEDNDRLVDEINRRAAGDDHSRL